MNLPPPQRRVCVCVFCAYLNVLSSLFYTYKSAHVFSLVQSSLAQLSRDQWGACVCVRALQSNPRPRQCIFQWNSRNVCVCVCVGLRACISFECLLWLSLVLPGQRKRKRRPRIVRYLGANLIKAPDDMCMCVSVGLWRSP